MLFTSLERKDKAVALEDIRILNSEDELLFSRKFLVDPTAAEIPV